MEIKAKLQKPITDGKRLDFVVEYNHKQGYEIRETEEEIQAWGYTEEEIALQEKERIARLFLTGADVERGIYQAKGMDFDDILEFVKTNPPEGLDVKALKIELKANNFYRGNPYVDAIGGLLGFTKEQLDLFFEDGDYTHLLHSEQVSDPNLENENADVEDVLGDDVTHNDPNRGLKC